MDKVIYQADLDKTLALFKEILSKQAIDALQFIEKKQEEIITNKSNSAYYITFSTLPQYLTVKEASYSKETLKTAAELRKNWDLSFWFLDQVARVYLMLLFAKFRLNDFNATLDKIINAADAHELITIYQAFPLFPYPECLLLHATNGIRCNMISAFNAIAVNNAYPADFFDEKAWDQLVLKALMVDSPIEKIIGLKRRANLTLAHALLNTARERLAAHRPIKLEIWYLIGVAADQEILKELKGFLEDKSEILQHGALIACNQSHLSGAKELLKQYAEQCQHRNIQENLLKIKVLDQSLTN